MCQPVSLEAQWNLQFKTDFSLLEIMQSVKLARNLPYLLPPFKKNIVCNFFKLFLMKLVKIMWKIKQQVVRKWVENAC